MTTSRTKQTNQSRKAAFTARLPERVIGTIRRECLDHVIIWNEAHLRTVLRTYAHYYNASRTHLSLGKDAPEGREIESAGEIVALPALGGLHHVYGRRANAKDSHIR